MHKRLNYTTFNMFLTLISIIVGSFLIVSSKKDFVILFASFYLILICLIDAKYSKIPNIITLSFFILSLYFNVKSFGMNGLLFSVLGSLSGLGLMLLPFLFGGFGAGDVKALAALGALLGSGKVFQVFLYMGITGGIIGIIYFIIAGNFIVFIKKLWHKFLLIFFTKSFKSLNFDTIQKSIRFPYAIAIAFGYYFHEFFGAIF